MVFTLTRLLSLGRAALAPRTLCCWSKGFRVRSAYGARLGVDFRMAVRPRRSPSALVRGPSRCACAMRCFASQRVVGTIFPLFFLPAGFWPACLKPGWQTPAVWAFASHAGWWPTAWSCASYAGCSSPASTCGAKTCSSPTARAFVLARLSSMQCSMLYDCRAKTRFEPHCACVCAHPSSVSQPWCLGSSHPLLLGKGIPCALRVRCSARRQTSSL